MSLRFAFYSTMFSGSRKFCDYITIKFDSFTFENHTLNGTVQLDLDED